ncbi:hypothetical protein CEXT_684831 [Caerostris extrusa]|uniref:Uncharacterized protein n=1 Tax=Caerostris extrusa TaxID=172846 RepID=A0AAV4NXW1_CAEEX|nr:hypothetical protein CEXT_684831 [Caerostris extrusa]
MQECGGVDKDRSIAPFPTPFPECGRDGGTEGKNRCMRAPPVDSGAAQLPPFHSAIRHYSEECVSSFDEWHQGYNRQRCAHSVRNRKQLNPPFPSPLPVL